MKIHWLKSVVRNYLNDYQYNEPIVTGGCGNLKKRVEPFIKLSHSTNIATLILADLDNHQDSSALISNWLMNKKKLNNFLFLISVKEIESWVIADHENFSKWSSIPINKIPTNPDKVFDIKQNLINLVKSYGKTQLKEDILPHKNNITSKVGIGYNNALASFVKEKWSPENARMISPSLNKALEDIENFKRIYPIENRMIEK